MKFSKSEWVIENMHGEFKVRKKNDFEKTITSVNPYIDIYSLNYTFNGSTTKKISKDSIAYLSNMIHELMNRANEEAFKNNHKEIEPEDIKKAWHRSKS